MAALLVTLLSLGVRADGAGQASAPAKAREPVGDPLASVNGYTITTEDVLRYVRLMHGGAEQGADALRLAEREQLDIQKRKEALEALIQTRLLYELGRQEYFGGESGPAALKKIGDREYLSFEERAGSKLRAAQILSEAGLTPDQYRDLVVQDLVAGEVLRDKVLARVSITPTEIRAYYDEHARDFTIPRTVVYRQILFAVADRADEAVQRDKAEQALKEIKAGADFARLADAASADSDTYPGGLHEVQVPTEAGDWTPPAVVGLAPGQLSEVRAVAGGFCVARLEEVRAPRAPSFEGVQSAIKAKLFARRKAAVQAEYLARLKDKAHIQYFPAAGELGLP